VRNKETSNPLARFQVFTAVKVPVDIVWVVTCSVVAVSICRLKWRWRQHGPPKRWYTTTTLHGVETQKTTTWIQTLLIYLESLILPCQPLSPFQSNKVRLPLALEHERPLRSARIKFSSVI